VPGTPEAEITAAIGTPEPAGAAPPASTPAGVRPARRRMLVGAGLVLAAVLVASGVAYAQYGRNGGEEDAGGATPAASTPASATSPATPADELCTDEIKSNRRWVCLTSAVIAGGKLTLKYDVEYAGSKPDVNKGYHVHFYGSDGKNPPDHVMGSHAPRSTRGKYYYYYYDDRQPSVLSTDDSRFTSAIGDAKKVCARIAIAGHGLVPDNNSTYKTGNCVPITRS
jgi:hypothetical protein